MSFDHQRAALVTQPYRYVVFTDHEALALYPNSREIQIDTALDVGGANQLANEIQEASGVSTRTFTFDIIGQIYPDDFISGPPRFTLSFDRFPSADPLKIYTLISATVRPISGTSTLTVRG